MICACSREQYIFEEVPEPNELTSGRIFSQSALSTRTTESEARFDDSNIEEAESSLREAATLNNEEARALLGKLEYQRGNFEAALQLFDGIDLIALGPRLKHCLSERARHRKSRTETSNSLSLRSASLLFEAVYLKSKSLQELGRPEEAARECKLILDTVEPLLPKGKSDHLRESKLREMIGKAVELLPELWKQAGLYHEAVMAYRMALLTPWSLDAECCARIQKGFAVFLLYWGVEAGAPTLAYQAEGAFSPKNNTEEAILLLLILLRKCSLKRLEWDPSILEHLTFALSMCGQSEVLVQQFEELQPGTISRRDRWYNMGLCSLASGKSISALNLVRKCLGESETPEDFPSLLLAAKLCLKKDALFVSEGLSYARKAINNAKGKDEHMKSVAYGFLGRALAKEAAKVFSDSKRSCLRHEALSALTKAASLDESDSDIMFHLAMQYAELRNLSTALEFAKRYIDLTGGTCVKGWRLLALILSGQRRYSDALMVIETAVNETSKWQQGELLRMKAKLQIAQGHFMPAIETYQLLLALGQAQRKSVGCDTTWRLKVDKSISEADIWQDLACLYTHLKKWQDAEVCLDKAAGALKAYSAPWWHTTGLLYEAQGKDADALAAFRKALDMDPGHMASKISLGIQLKNKGHKFLPVARSFLMDALRVEPTNHLGWYNLGLIRQLEGHAHEASDCFQAAFLLEESSPIDNFSSLL